MGYDDENLEPKPRKISNKKNGKTIENEKIADACSKSYCIIYGDEKRQFNAFTSEELVSAIYEKFNLCETAANQFKIEYWSNLYQEWILLDEHLPETNSKLKVTSLSTESGLKKDEGQDEMERKFCERLNGAFRRYIESDEGDVLDNFETAIIFTLKRKNLLQQQLAQLQVSNNNLESLNELNVKLDDVRVTINQMNEDIKQLKQQSNKQFRTHFEKLSTKLKSTTFNDNKDKQQPETHINDTTSSTSSSSSTTNKKSSIKNRSSCIIC